MITLIVIINLRCRLPHEAQPPDVSVSLKIKKNNNKIVLNLGNHFKVHWGGQLFEAGHLGVGTNSRLGTYSNKYGT